MCLKFNLEDITRSSIKALQPYASARDEFVGNAEGMIFLDANENPFENGVNRYPDPHQNALKTKLSKLKDIPEDQILLGNGSDEILDLIFRAFCEPGEDNVITLPPTYGMYHVLAQINNIKVNAVDLDAQFQPRIEAILDTVDAHTRLIFLCSPNNPTGNSINIEHIEKLTRNFRGLIVIDEAYIDFSNKESWVYQLNHFENIIVTQTLSKAYAMAGIRLGICYASREIIALLKRIKPPYNVNILTQKKAIEALSNTEEIQKQIKQTLDERHVLADQLLNIHFISKVYPSEANFLLVKVDDATKRYQDLIERGIVVRNRTTQPGCKNTLRFTIGTPEENKKLIDTLKAMQ